MHSFRGEVFRRRLLWPPQIEDLDPLLVTLQRCAARLTYLSLLGNPCSPDQLTGDRFTPEDYARHR